MRSRKRLLCAVLALLISLAGALAEDVGAEPVPEPEKTSPLTVICCILSCIVPFFGIILGLMLRGETDERRRKLGSDLLVCGCLPTIGLGVLIGGVMLFSKDEQKKTVGKKCLAASFISLMLGLFLLSGGFSV